MHLKSGNCGIVGRLTNQSSLFVPNGEDPGVKKDGLQKQLRAIGPRLDEEAATSSTNSGLRGQMEIPWVLFLLRLCSGLLT